MNPKQMQSEPTTKYAIPKNGFLPPIQVAVLITKVLRPPNPTTGNPRKLYNFRKIDQLVFKI